MDKKKIFLSSMLIYILFYSISCEKKDEKITGVLKIANVKIGDVYLETNNEKNEVEIDLPIIISFNSVLDTNTVRNNIFLREKESNTSQEIKINYSNEYKTIVIIPNEPLKNLTGYLFQIKSGISGSKGEKTEGAEYMFITKNGELIVESVLINDKSFSGNTPLRNIDFENIEIEVNFSVPLDPANYQSYFVLSGNKPVVFSLSQENKRVTIAAEGLKYYTRYYFTISENLKAANNFVFRGFAGSFYTKIDTTAKFPLISDNELLTLIQKQTFKYFWDFAHPASGLARERNASGDIVTIGGSGFGVMALIVGMERNFITRSEGVSRMEKILDFLETCDRYHGAWPHWLNGNTGKTVPFSPKDDGGDLVETSFMIQGLTAMKQYLDSANISEKQIIERIKKLSDEVEYDFFTRGENVLYWHWSPNTGWEVNLKIEGYNETLITYILAASSINHGISPEVYKTGYTRSGIIVNGRSFYNYTLPLGNDYGGPLFFTHYSFLGLDPGNLKDNFADYWEQNVNHSLINWAYCVDNPKDFIGYSEVSWGLTASDNPWGYNAHSPTNDLSVITPSAAISSIPYTPKQSLDAIKHFYYVLGDRLWGEYGFYDAFSVTEGWWANSYIAIDQGPIICMIENYRTGLLWKLFMSDPAVKNGLNKLGFSY